MKGKLKAVKIHELDNVAVALQDLQIGDIIDCKDQEIEIMEAIKTGHKFAVKAIAPKETIIKYGFPIGRSIVSVETGFHVHTHNTKTMLKEDEKYTYEAQPKHLKPLKTEKFMGYLRKDGCVAVRNELWIIPTVGCVNSVAQKLAEINKHLANGTIDGIHAFPHPYGCSQMGEDHEQTKRILAALARHPNAGGVLILGLGCENNKMDQFKEEIGDYDPDRIKFLVSQESKDELVEASKLLQELAKYASSHKRQLLPVSDLVVGLKCGGSDGLSGITANPSVGQFSDILIDQGGTSILTEVPEMFGAEQMLMNRAESEIVFSRMVNMINNFKNYFIKHGQTIYENPSPGNKEGGITTLEDKSCGCIQKGGQASIVDVISYGKQISKKGLNLLEGPGNDLVSTTALAAAGAQIILFTTGRGTPFGSPVPTVKISTNTPLFQKKNNWIDFDAGTIAKGESVEENGQKLWDYVVRVASGQKVLNEVNNYREIAIWKEGVTL